MDPKSNEPDFKPKEHNSQGNSHRQVTDPPISNLDESIDLRRDLSNPFLDSLQAPDQLAGDPLADQLPEQQAL